MQANEKANRVVLSRTLFLMIVCGIVVFIPLIFKLYDLMIRQHDYFEELAIDNQTRSTSITAARGIIYDRNMNILATSATVENVFIDPNEIEKNGYDLAKIATGLSEILDVDADYIIEQAQDTTKRYKVIARKQTEETTQLVRDFINNTENIGGIYLEPDSKRYYPYGSLAAQVIGFVSADNVGAEGLEAYYNSMLEGTSGKIVTTKGNYGSEMLYSYEKYYDADNGDNLILTLDTTVQYYLEKNMEAAIEKYDVLNGAFGIVMDVNTGEILAMATMGSYDPNNYQEIYDDEMAKALEEQYQEAISNPEGSQAYEDGLAAYNAAVATARLQQWRNRVVSDGYEPGSTFKIITLASALEEGAVGVDDTFYCSGSTNSIKGRVDPLHCWKATGHGTQTTKEALGNSCNIAFADIGIALGGEKLYEYVENFGLREETGVDLPGEASGYFFNKGLLTDPNSQVSLTSASFGQTFKVTPLQLVRAISAVVNGGYLLQPYIVSEVQDSEGNTVLQNGRTVLRQVISEEASAIMREMLEYVVEGGTASNAQVAGYRIGGKTGTSEKIDVFDENGQPVDDLITSFVGIAPINDPQYICLVALDTPSTATGIYISGGVMAAPTVRDVLSDILPYLGVEPDYSDDEISAVNVATPDVVGLTEADAAEALKEKSLTYRVVGDGETVTDQIPVGGASVPGASEIVLYMGEEKPTDKITVPNFIGLSVAQANDTAANAGLYIQAKGTNKTDSNVTVTYQSVEAGVEVNRGTTITVEFTDHSARD